MKSLDDLNASINDSFYFSEQRLEKLRVRLENVIKEGKTICLYSPPFHLGDNLIKTSAINWILQRFCDQRNLQLPKILISKQPGKNDFDLVNEIQAFADVLPVAFQRAVFNFYHGYLLWLSIPLGVEITEEDLQIPPQLYWSDFVPMNNYSEEEVELYTRSLQAEMDPEATYLILLHGGSKGIKRCGRDQVRYLKNNLKAIFPRLKLAILTAQGIDGNGGPELTEDDADITIQADENINKTIALFRAPKKVKFAGTDTFLTWLAGAAITSRPDHPDHKLKPGDLTNLYTIASCHYWSVPGSIKVPSLAQQAYGYKNGNHLLTDEVYKKFPGYENFDGEHIPIEDLDLLLESAKNQILINEF